MARSECVLLVSAVVRLRLTSEIWALKDTKLLARLAPLRSAFINHSAFDWQHGMPWGSLTRLVKNSGRSSIPERLIHAGLFSACLRLKTLLP